jgi:hypothetical protein
MNLLDRKGNPLFSVTGEYTTADGTLNLSLSLSLDREGNPLFGVTGEYNTADFISLTLSLSLFD